MSQVPLKALALLPVLTIVWGTTWPLFHVALAEAGPWTFRTGVLSVSAVLLAAYVHVRGESFAVPKGRWLPLCVSAFFNLGFWNIATSLAVMYLPSGHASVLAYTMPLWVALLGFLFFRQRLTPRLALALAIGAAAVVALIAPEFASYADAPWGLFWGLAAGCGWALGTFVMKRTNWGGMGIALTFWQVAVCLPAMAVGAPLLEGWPHFPSPTLLLVTLYVGAGPMATGTAIWFTLVKWLPEQVAGLCSIAVPIVAVLAGVVFLHEPLSTLQAVAIGSTVISLWLALTPRRSV
ncbi:MAG TPA: DMT family transporter [Reyranella sp.]|nr:DMT family transporter [Reyranella sp.]